LKSIFFTKPLDKTTKKCYIIPMSAKIASGMDATVTNALAGVLPKAKLQVLKSAGEQTIAPAGRYWTNVKRSGAEKIHRLQKMQTAFMRAYAPRMPILRQTADLTANLRQINIPPPPPVRYRP
jgi:hypothetical protein